MDIDPPKPRRTRSSTTAKTPTKRSVKKSKSSMDVDEQPNLTSPTQPITLPALAPNMPAVPSVLNQPQPTPATFQFGMTSPLPALLPSLPAQPKTIDQFDQDLPPVPFNLGNLGQLKAPSTSFAVSSTPSFASLSSLATTKIGAPTVTTSPITVPSKPKKRKSLSQTTPTTSPNVKKVKSPKLDRNSSPSSFVSTSLPSTLSRTTTATLIADSNAEDELLNEVAPETPEEVHFGDCNCTIVGLRYYTGVVNNGEKVMLEREPRNPYDANAIKANNVLGHQVGHIKREKAAAFAPLIDSRFVRLEGTIFGGGTNNTFQTDVKISVYGIAANEVQVINHLKKFYITLTKPQPIIEAPGPSHVDLLARGEILDTSSKKNALDGIFSSLQNAKLNIPSAEAPAGLLSDLLVHQAKGLAWMLYRENPPAPTATESQLFWTFNQKLGMYHNSLTLSTVKTAPQLARGGLLADEMGLGKTLQIIALIMVDLQRLNSTEKLAEGEIKTTLIICPVSVLGNWQKQIETHVAPGNLTYYVYHGPGRNTNQAFLSSQDVVLTTYQTLALENNGSLTRLQFRRIVLDEGHLIKAYNSKQAKAACAVKAQRRWVISGTPIQNKVDDLYSLIKFIGLSPFDDHDWWNRLFTRPLKRNNSPEALKQLQVLISYVTIRRLKNMQIDGQPIITLPQKTIYLHKVQFGPEEQQMYDKLFAEAKTAFQQFTEEGSVASNFANMLSLLTRLRQMCDHPSLVSKAILESLHAFQANPAEFLKKPEGKALLKALLDHDSDECSICLDNVNTPVVTMCGHVFCKQCIEQVIQIKTSCPLCRQEVSADKLFQAPPQDELATQDGDAEPSSTVEGFKSSAKIDALLEFLKALRTKDPTIKSVVFSQWTSMLDLVEIPLRTEGFVFRRLDGTMNRKKRDQAISDFEGLPDVPVMLISLKCGSLGLNLTAANNVFILDPWWNPAAEDQAIDRVHRIGQKKEVTVVRFVIQGTVEDRVFALQQQKRELANQTIGKGSDNSEEIKSRRLQDLKTLFLEQS